MKRLKTSEDIERVEKRKKRIGVFVLVALLVFSTAGFAFGNFGGSSSSNNQQNEGEYYNGQYWVYPTRGQEFYFSEHSSNLNLEAVNVNKNIQNYAGKNLYVDSENNLALNELYANLGRFAGRVQEACYSACERDLPELGCEENIIIFRDRETENIREDGNCVFIDGDLGTVDAFLHRVLGLN